ncbi:MAG: ABC transporter permease [Chitinophagaceae bacterium]
MWKQKSFSFLNIAGLATGIASAALIFLWVEDELSYNHYFKNRDNLYQVMQNQAYEGKIYTFSAQPGLLAPSMQAEIPGIRQVARTTWGNRSLLTKGEKSVYGFGMNVDSSFLSMFSFEFIRGNAVNAFSQLHSLVISASLAKKLFNSTDVVGQTVKMENAEEYVIGGVINNLPDNCRFKEVEWFAPFETFFRNNQWLTQWGNNGIQTFATLQPEADLAAVNKKLNGFIQSKMSDAISRPFLLSANDWRLRSNFSEGKQSGGRITRVRLFSSIAWIILILACINFMNLATARSEKRQREVGVRKVMGSGKGKLITQFIAEALVMSFISVLLAILLVTLILPSFNHFVQKNMVLGLSNPVHITAILLIGLICGLIAGSYPAFYLSSFNPVQVLKGLKLKTSGAAFVRKGLVTTQFVISVGLIICTVIIYGQVMHTKDRELGINKSNLIYMSQQLISINQGGQLKTQFGAVKNELLSTGVVENAALSNSAVFTIGSNSGDFKWEGKDPSKTFLIGMEWASPEYISTMGMKLVAGRDFYQDGVADSNNVVINETFARLMAKKPEETIGKVIIRDDARLTVTGVIKDFVYNNVYGTVEPMMIFCDPNASNTQRLTVRLKTGTDYKAALPRVEAVIKKFNPAYPFEYSFVDKDFERLFEGENIIGTLAALFAGLAIFISSLGLFGLAAYTAERRIKEIGIRKVLGASIAGVTALLSRDFLKLVVISCVIAVPVAWYFMHRWLQQYEYRVSISWWMFVLPAVIAIVIAVITVSFQAVRAALANPVRSLRSE